jgi:hypothetical protein
MPRFAYPGTGSTLALLLWASALPAQTPAPAVRLIAHPAAVELDGPQARHRILVSAAAPDGSTVDVTGKSAFRSEQPAVVSVAADGECTARGDGSARVAITYNGQSVTVPVTVRRAAETRPPSFTNDVLPLLTRMGCNQGACHGKGSGQNGFRLSLRGYAPEWDHAWITREFSGRRVNRAAPEASLLLCKPLGQAPHEGGKLFTEGSRAHRLLLDWIGAGARGPSKDDPSVRRIDILPGDCRLRPGQQQQLLVRAEFGDGHYSDVTWLTQFVAADASVAEVDANGLVRMLRPGETTVRATFMGQVAVVLLTAPHDRPVRPELLAKRNNFIDEHVFNKLAALGIEPSDLCTDEAFIRRAYLDTVGLLPTPEEVRAFLADRSADRRARLIDWLLGRPEFVDFWALQLGDLLQNRKESDHDVRGTKGVRSFHEWLRRQVAINRPWDELARDVLTVTGTTSAQPAVGYFIVTVGEHREAERSTVVASVAQTFLGTRIGCAQCHNHPLEKYTQDDYYHFAGFFSRIKLQRKDPKQRPTTLLVSAADASANKRPVGVTQPRTGQFLKPQPLDRSAVEVKPGDDPRRALAAWMTDPHNESFAGAMVNRLWAHFLGVGLVEPIDDLRASNPPTNPQLWKALVREFVTHKFDRKHLMRLILNSRTYQLSAATRPTNAKDTRFYSHYYARRLPAEVMLDALARSTGVPDAFPGYPVGLRAVQIPDPSMKSYFLSLFGRSERITACACERTGEVTMPQLLHLQNGESVVRKIGAPEGRLAGLLKAGKTDAQVSEELFLATLARLPSASERRALEAELRGGEARDVVFRDLFWALLNSKEFAFNH